MKIQNSTLPKFEILNFYNFKFQGDGVLRTPSPKLSPDELKPQIIQWPSRDADLKVSVVGSWDGNRKHSSENWEILNICMK